MVAGKIEEVCLALFLLDTLLVLYDELKTGLKTGLNSKNQGIFNRDISIKILDVSLTTSSKTVICAIQMLSLAEQPCPEMRYLLTSYFKRVML